MGGGGGYCHFEFAYLYELICNAKSIQRFKGTLQCDWLLVWSPDTLFVHYFAHLPIYLGVEFLVEGLHTSVSRFCCCCVFQSCFSCLKNMSKPCYWQEAKQPRYRGRIKYLQHGKALVPQTLMHTYIYIWIILVGQQYFLGFWGYKSSCDFWLALLRSSNYLKFSRKCKLHV